MWQTHTVHKQSLQLFQQNTSCSSKENFLMRRWMMVATISLISSLALVGCGGGDDPTPLPAATATVETVLPGGAVVEPAGGAPAQQETTNTGASDAAVASTGGAEVDVIAAALRKQIENLPMRMTMGDATGADSMVAEMASANAFHITAADMELIMVDGKVYMKMGNEWVQNDQMAGIVNGMVEAFTPENIAEQISTIVAAEQLPDENVNGEAANVYLMTVNSPIGSEGDAASKVYIRISDGLPIRVASADGAETPYQVDYEYDPSITVVAPQ
jgi:hypothetical protein